MIMNQLLVAFASSSGRKEQLMFKEKWTSIPSTTFVNSDEAEGKELLLIDTKYLRIRLQRFRVGSIVKYHDHPHELEIVLRLGWGILLAIYPPKMRHYLFGPTGHKNSWWSILSIKIGKRR